MKFPIPDAALDDRLAILGTSGSGKTYLTLTAIERLLTRGARSVAVDPLGVMWGLRLKADGKTPSGFNVPIFGGRHGDLPLNEHAGALIGETVATMRESCIVDLSELPTKSAERRFMTAFLEAIYRATNPDKVEPYHLIIDEADRFAPQKPPKGDETMLNRMEEIVRRGRVKGFIPWLITQRPAVLNKNVLSQADGLVLLKLTASQDRDQVGAWIEGQADRAQGKAILGSLPTMQRGQGVVWIPGRGILETSQFPQKETFDSSRAPKRGEKKRANELKPLDLGALKERLATVEAETKANDPKSLKAELAALKAKIAAASNQKNVSDPELHDRDVAFADGKQTGWSEGYIAGDRDGFARGTAAALSQGFQAITGAMKAFVGVEFVPPQHLPKPPQDTKGSLTRAQTSQCTERPHRGPKIVDMGPRARTNNGVIHLPPGERAVLIAAAQFGAVDREQLTVLTGYKRSSRDAYIQRLKEKGFVETDGRSIKPTQEGLNALPADYEPLPIGRGLQDYWLARLPEGERRILQELIDAYPNAVARTDLDEATGYKRSSRDAYLQRMKAKRLWEPHGVGIKASGLLF